MEIGVNWMVYRRRSALADCSLRALRRDACVPKNTGYRSANGFRSRQVLVAQSAASRLEITVKSLGLDRYGRTIAEVLLPEGRVLNHEMVKAGLAWWSRKYVPDDGTVAQLEAKARAAKRGLWADAEPVPPWEWRKR